MSDAREVDHVNGVSADADRAVGTITGPAPGRDFSDNGQLSPKGRAERTTTRPRKRPKQERETREYRDGLIRQLIAYERRVGGLGDIEELPGMVDLSRILDELIDKAARQLHDDHGYSWTEIADRMKTWRQAARQRWGRKTEL